MENSTSLHKRGYLREAEAGLYLGKKPSTMRAWRVKGRGPRYYKIGGNIFYQSSDLDAWIESQARGSTSNVAA